MGKNSKVSLKRVKGAVASRRGAGKNNVGKVQKGDHSMNADSHASKAETSHGTRRSKATINRLKMYRSGGRAIRAKNGQVIKPMPFQSWTPSGTMARIEPNRRWFGNTRVIGQKELSTFRDAISDLKQDPYSFVVKQNKLPMSLLTDPKGAGKSHILSAESFESTFGKKSKRKRPAIGSHSMDELRAQAEEREDTYDPAKDRDLHVPSVDDIRDHVRDNIFKKGQSKRLWGELYKVIDSSDVVVQVLDARDPMGTRSAHIEDYLKKEKGHKQLVFVLNKCDLVPNWATSRWVAELSKSYPTLAFHASVTNCYGKGALIELLRQFGRLHDDKQQISVGFIGYPNVGKSSVINSLRAEKVCKTAPIPGETKVWQYVTLMKKIYLIDCPGVVYPTGDSESAVVLKGVVRVEQLKTPEDYIPAVLERARPQYIERLYGIKAATPDQATDFLERLALRLGRLLKGAEPDVRSVAIIVLHDWQTGKIPYFCLPPAREDTPAEAKAKAEAAAAADKAVEGTAADAHVNTTTDTQPELEAESAPAVAVDALAMKQAIEDAPQQNDFFDDEDLVPVDGPADAATLAAADENGATEEYDVSWDDLFGDKAGAAPEEAAAAAAAAAEVPLEDDDDAASSKRGSDAGGRKRKSEAEGGRSKKTVKSVGGQAKALRIAKKKKKAARAAADAAADPESDDGIEDDGGKYKKQVKEPRMTTNKMKVGTHYYASANVKGRKRRPQNPGAV
eukprot:m.165190 g.165190  ORF g.165190 m.165190 type:complete len:734 (-) comp12529_c0_seq1:968-3169(-)